MKKKIFYYFLPILAFIACSEDFTETPAVGALSDEALQNPQGVDLLLTGTYSALTGVVNNNGGNQFAVGPDNWWLDVMSDDAHKGSTDGDQLDLFLLETYAFTPANPYLLARWEALYAGANRANAVLNVINGIEGEDISAKEAEARFLRSYFNFELQKIYGNPAFISVENYANSNFNQPNPGPIWGEVESDLQFAIDNLPDVQAEAGRPTSWTAKAFLGKAYLFQEKWQEAFNILQDVIQNGPYALNEEFVANFTAAGENGPETVFAVQFAADGGQSFNGNVGGTLNFPNALGFCCGFYVPTQDLVNAYKTGDDGLPLLDTYADSDIANDYGIESDQPFTPETGPLDPRLDYTVGRRGIEYNGFGLHPGKEWIRNSFADISGPYLPKKNVYQAGEDENKGTGAWGQQHSGVNYNVMRFAGVLLMAAEAAAELGDLDTALDYVNRVRERAKNMSVVQAEDGSPAANYNIDLYTSFPDQDFAIKAVRFERRLELAMEGHRYFDLARWGAGYMKNVIDEYIANETSTIPNFGPKTSPFQQHMVIMPIPTTAIDLSGGILEQNPGY
ncbi:RagB/SusD family nutrient uptake outer membrane protein [Christiangramia sabulilitoris]|uniref:RagB/SusD family nutrient uptake outer membrane protein n=1 Tax=Christiangramia sabulilitoris TaxID=2583991 RepID=A0A550I840_9FLAO|nr:RagB/SusD family nutrient uptake outer membrane protein [Christiangramia sabulilitoris]TRO67143.1 RagB/SusD family nutrient uptake outer membrane protein [Christiangramia sabulilitoris]